MGIPELRRRNAEKNPPNSLAVVVCDLDGLVQIDDRYGHWEGDTVLPTIAAEFKQPCRKYTMSHAWQELNSH
jgi:diguanylate cyclase (GGDEF)-like protein